MLRNYIQIFLVFVNMVIADKTYEDPRDTAKKSFASLLQNIIDINEKRVGAMKDFNNLQDSFVTKNALTKIHELDDLFVSDETVDDKDHAMLALTDINNNLDLTLRRTYKANPKASNDINIIFLPNYYFNSKPKYSSEKSVRDRYMDILERKLKDKREDETEIYKKVLNRNTNDNIKNKRDQTDNKIFGRLYEIKEHVQRNEDTDSEIVCSDDQLLKDNEQPKSRKRFDCGGKKAYKICKKACIQAYKNTCMVYMCGRQVKKGFKRECKRNCRIQYSDDSNE